MLFRARGHLVCCSWLGRLPSGGEPCGEFTRQPTNTAGAYLPTFRELPGALHAPAGGPRQTGDGVALGLADDAVHRRRSRRRAHVERFVRTFQMAFRLYGRALALSGEGSVTALVPFVGVHRFLLRTCCCKSTCAQDAPQKTEAIPSVRFFLVSLLIGGVSALKFCPHAQAHVGHACGQNRRKVRVRS